MLNKAQRMAVQEQITRCLKSGQSETVGIGRHLEYIFDEADMTPALLLTSLEELEASAQAMRRELQSALGVSEDDGSCGCACHWDRAEGWVQTGHNCCLNESRGDERV